MAKRAEERIGKQDMEEMEEVLGGIVKELSEMPEEASCFCSHAVFQGIYGVMERERRPFCLVLCTVMDSGGHMAFSREGQMDKLSGYLEDAIRGSVPRDGIACRYGEGQCLLLLPDFREEDWASVRGKIDRYFSGLCPEGWHVDYCAKEAPFGKGQD